MLCMQDIVLIRLRLYRQLHLTESIYGVIIDIYNLSSAKAISKKQSDKWNNSLDHN